MGFAGENDQLRLGRSWSSRSILCLSDASPERHVRRKPPHFSLITESDSPSKKAYESTHSHSRVVALQALPAGAAAGKKNFKATAAAARAAAAAASRSVARMVPRITASPTETILVVAPATTSVMERVVET